MRDLTKTQFKKKLEANGIRPDAFGFFYVHGNTLVYSKNGGDTRREQLAYLLAEQRRISEKEKGQGGHASPPPVKDRGKRGKTTP